MKVAVGGDLQVAADEAVRAIRRNVHLHGWFAGARFVELVQVVDGAALRAIADCLVVAGVANAAYGRGFVDALRVGSDDRDEGAL